MSLLLVQKLAAHRTPFSSLLSVYDAGHSFLSRACHFYLDAITELYRLSVQLVGAECPARFKLPRSVGYHYIGLGAGCFKSVYSRKVPQTSQRSSDGKRSLSVLLIAGTVPGDSLTAYLAYKCSKGFRTELRDIVICGNGVCQPLHPCKK